jgi:initiation factor 1A
MPTRNVRGGKGFKKGRKDDGDKDSRIKFEGKDVDQQYARITTVLGDRRFKCFCDDGVERLCKVRGVLCWGPKRQRMEVGDIVLISQRPFGTGEDGDHADISDIITKIPHQFWREIRREHDIHPELFAGVSEPTTTTGTKDDDIFDDGSDGEGDKGGGETIQHIAPRTRKSKWSAAVAVESDGDNNADLDIDAI